jgi:hypothetical protein
LVAYTSSLDEILAIQATLAGLGHRRQPPPQPFADQIDWLGALVAFVEQRNDLQLAVRIHPREGVTARDNVSSQHLRRLRAAFDRPYNNCRFFWPQDKVSSYDLGELADVALISWSTIGLEMARVGVPVLASTQGVAFFPHDDFLEWGPTRESYFQTLEALLHRTSSADLISGAFRWYNLFHLGHSLHLGDVVPTFDFHGLPPFRLPAEARTVEDIVLGGQDALEINHVRQVQGQHARAEAEERTAIAVQLRRVLRFIIGGSDSTEDYRLIVVSGHPGARPPRHGPGVKILIREGGFVRWVDGRYTRERYSPLCARLASLCAQEVLDSSLSDVA